MAHPLSFDHVTDWVFDLDNTLYPRTCNLFAQIDRLITHYVDGRHQAAVRRGAGAAEDLLPRPRHDAARADGHARHRSGPLPRRRFTRSTTRRSPRIPSWSRRSRPCRDGSSSSPMPIPGTPRRCSSGSAAAISSTASSISAARRIEPKPLPRSRMTRCSRRTASMRSKAAMFDDLEKNLLVPHEIGMRTVQVVAGEDYAHEQVEAWELGRSTAAARPPHDGRPRGVPRRPALASPIAPIGCGDALIASRQEPQGRHMQVFLRRALFALLALLPTAAQAETITFWMASDHPYPVVARVQLGGRTRALLAGRRA